MLSDRTFVKASDAKTLDMRDEHWQLMTDLLPVLQPVQTVKALLSSETTPSSSTVYPLIYKLKEVTLAVQPDDSATVQSFKTDLQHALSDRFKLDDVATPGHPFVMASVLDPVTKSLDNFPVAFKQAAYETVRGMLSSSTSGQPTAAAANEPTESDCETAAPSPKKVKLSNRAATVAFLGLTGASTTPDVGVRQILVDTSQHRCRRTDMVGRQRFLISECRSCRQSLSGHTRHLVMSERQFSAAGRLITKLRNRLEPDCVDTILFLYKNM